MSPLNVPVIPPGWSEHHRPVVVSTATGRCEVVRSSGPAPYPLPPDWVGEETVWRGKCRLQQLSREQTVFPGEQPTELRAYLIVIPFTADNLLPPLRTGERGDSVLVDGVRYRLKQRLNGSELWEHDFIAIENQTQEGEVGR